MSNAGLPGVRLFDPQINAVQAYGGMVGLQYFFTRTIRTNAAIGGVRLIQPSYTSRFGACVGAPVATGSCGAFNKAEWAGSINLIWSPIKASGSNTSTWSAPCRTP